LPNASPEPVDLSGRRLADRPEQSAPVPAGTLPRARRSRWPLPPDVQLGNGGGAITVLDADALKVDGVSYTGEQAHREGWTIVF